VGCAYNRGMSGGGQSRRRTVLWLAAGVLLFFALLGALQAFNPSGVKFLNPDTAGETLAFTGLTVVVFLLLLVLLLLLLRNILKAYADQSSSALGARLRTRMVLGAVIIALTPAVFMFLFSFQLMNRSIDRWFTQPTAELRQDSTRVALELAQYVTNNARVEAQSIAASGAVTDDTGTIDRILSAHRITLAGGFVFVYDKNERVMGSYRAPPEASSATLQTWLNGEEKGTAIPLRGPLSAAVYSTAQHLGQPVLRVGEREYALGMAATAEGKTVVVALPMPQGLSQTTARIRSGAEEYWQLFRSRHQVRTTFILMLMLITTVVFFASVWLALFLSKQITRPVEALADAMDEIAAGKYDHRVQLMSSGEMGELIESFNHMAGDLEASRQMAERSAAQLSEAHHANEVRRRELETIVETIPSGVVTLDATGTVLQANRAFAVLLGVGNDGGLRGKKLEALLPAESVEDFAGVIRRGRRMGAASTEMEMHTGGRTMHLAVTSARLELGDGQAGTVLVVEDTSELLRAQRQVAWKEVAQRVAHEIKNPLTPIALSAERIGRHLDRHLDRGQPESNSIIRKCSEVILGCVSTLRTLVDQFSALAQFPAPQPRACDMNQVTDEALALFAGRLEGITVRRALEADLPQVLADPEAMRRALANLMDNAAEAMQGSLLRVLSVSSSLSEDGGAVEVVVADTGHGLTDEIRERLFLPFYSTKRRGTGLGLSIAAKIVQEHGGSIRAESNSPKGARFVVRLPLMEQTVSPAAEDGARAPVSEARP